MSKKKLDRISSTVLFCMAAAVLWYTKFKIIVPASYVSYGIGPQTIPSILSWTILALSALMFAGTFIKKDENECTAMSREEMKTLLVFVAAFAVYIILMPIIGFYVTTALFLTGIFAYLKVNKKAAIILIPCVLIAVYAIFTIVCKVYLPAGLLI